MLCHSDNPSTFLLTFLPTFLGHFLDISSNFKFDNEYFRNLLNLTWRRREWNGPEQFEDAEVMTHTH